jgi:small subunit ribosomal protein S1
LDSVILAIDAERERISLGIKQLEGDQFTSYVEEFPKGTVVKGKVTEVTAKLVTVELASDVVATVRAADLSDEKVEDASTLVAVGDELEAKIVTIDKKNRTISLSVKAKDAEEQAEVIKKYTKGNNDTLVSTTIGDLLKEKMANKDSE